MAKTGLYSRFIRQDTNYFYCTICEKQGKVHKTAYSGGSSNLSRHIKSSHPQEVSEVMVLKQSMPVNPFVDSAKKRRAAASDSQDCVVVDQGPPEKRAANGNTSSALPSTSADLSTSALPSTSATRTPSIPEMVEKLKDYEGGYLNICRAVYSLYF